MRRYGRRSPTASLFLISLSLFLFLASAAPSAGQALQRPPSSEPHRGLLVGAHVGIDYLFDGLVLGGQAHVLPDPWGRFALVPNAQVELRRGIRDWQANVDATAMPVQGFYVGAGVAYRSTIYPDEEDRETRRGYSLLFGLRPPAQPGDLGFHVQLRWTFVSDIVPRTVTIGADYPLLLWR